jgi:hypothetical protein
MVRIIAKEDPSVASIDPAPKKTIRAKMIVPKFDFCKIHRMRLERITCCALIWLVEENDQITLSHYGTHSHVRPLPKRASLAAKVALKAAVSNSKGSRPKNFLINGDTPSDISLQHNVFRNLGYLRYRRDKVLREAQTRNEISELASLQALLGFAFMRSESTSTYNGHYSIQTDFLREWSSSITTELQSDTTYGIISDNIFKNVNVTFTSAFCPVIERTIPVTMTIMFGQTKEHYMAHFLVVLESLGYESFEEYNRRFPGMIADFLRQRGVALNWLSGGSSVLVKMSM